jgi:hypothetical protein
MHILAAVQKLITHRQTFSPTNIMPLQHFKSSTPPLEVVQVYFNYTRNILPYANFIPFLRHKSRQDLKILKGSEKCRAVSANDQCGLRGLEYTGSWGMVKGGAGDR